MPTDTAPECARDLRRALKDLKATSEDANDLVRILTDGEHSTEAEWTKAQAALPDSLDKLARLENQLRAQLWFMAKVRRELYRLMRAGQRNLQK
jgi:hypothetical protein